MKILKWSQEILKNNLSQDYFKIWRRRSYYTEEVSMDGNSKTSILIATGKDQLWLSFLVTMEENLEDSQALLGNYLNLKCKIIKNQTIKVFFSVWTINLPSQYKDEKMLFTIIVIMVLVLGRLPLSGPTNSTYLQRNPLSMD